MAIELEESWLELLANEFEQEYMQSLRKFLQEEKQQGQVIYPASADTFYALNATPFDKVRVVILGQDPYHDDGQAHGLSFSVPTGVKPPPSLKNIFKELNNDLGITPNSSGDLTKWAHQGVLLLNAVLSVRRAQAASHKDRGWERFTDKIIHCLNNYHSGLVFILWGSYAQKKCQFIDDKRHLVIKSVHPSPLAAHRGFFGSKPFSRTNVYLCDQGKLPINWQLD